MTFSISEALKFGWHKTRANSGLLFKVLLVIFVLQVFNAIVSQVLEGQLIGVLALIAIGIAQFVVGVGLTVVTLRLAQGKHTELKNIIPPLEVLWRYFAASCLVGLIVMGVMLGILLVSLGAAALIGVLSQQVFPVWFAIAVILGVGIVGYIALRYSMVRYAILDGSGITESLRCSAKITEGHKWHLLGFLLALVGINILGALALIVGLLVTVPTTMIAYAYIYEKLHKHPHTHAR